MWKPALALLILVSLASPVLAGQALSGQTPTSEQTPTIRTTTREVILDVIVRDKHHHAIADLRPEELEIFEDGVKQRVNAFRNVQGAEQLKTEEAQAENKPTGPSAQAPRTPSTALRLRRFSPGPALALYRGFMNCFRRTLACGNHSPGSPTQFRRADS